MAVFFICLGNEEIPISKEEMIKKQERCRFVAYIGNFFLGNVTCINSGFGDLEVACWPLVPKFSGSNPAEAVGFFRAKKSSFGGEVKPSVLCRRFTACKIFLNATWKSVI